MLEVVPVGMGDLAEGVSSQAQDMAATVQEEVLRVCRPEWVN